MNFYAFSGLINGLVSSGLGLLLYSRSPQNPKHRTYGLYCLSLSLWSYFYCAWHLTDSDNAALMFVRLLMAGAILIPITHLHHVVTLLDRRDSHGALLSSGYVATGIFLLCDLTPAFVAKVEPQMGFAFWPRPGVVFPIYLLWFFFSIGYASYLFATSYRHTKGARRNQYLYLLVGSLIGYGGGATNFPLWYGIQLPPYGTILVSLYVGIVAYTLIKYRLLDFSLALEKGLTFLLLLGGISLPALVIFLYAQQVFFGYIHAEFSGVLLLVVAIIVVAAYRMMERTQAAVAKTLFRERHDRYETLSNFSKSLITNLDLKTLAQQIVSTLGKVMGIQSVVLYLYDKDREAFFPISHFAYRGSASVPPGPHNNDVLPVYLARAQSILVREEIENTPSLSSDKPIDTALQSLEAEVCLPLINKQQLLGFCTLGPRDNPNSYSSQDLDLLLTLSREAAIALDNALLYEELKRSQALVRRTDRLRSLETMAGGLAHEIRNPLTSIKAFVDLAPERKHDEEFLARFSKVVKEDVLRIERLTKEILDYARPAEPFLQTENINEIIESCLYALRVRPTEKRCTIETDLAHHVPQVRVDRQQIKQVLLNLFLNAFESMEPQGGTLVVRTHVVPKSKGKDFVQIEIQDTGAGIAQHDLEHIFDPFFTTKHLSQEHEGTGLGLAISHQIIREHDGYIEVTSELGNGSIFLVNLPACSKDSPVPEEANRMPEDQADQSASRLEPA